MRRPLRIVGALLAVAGASYALVVARAAPSREAASAAASDAASTIPLATSLAATGGTWADLAMGHVRQPVNTFWQMFRLAGSTSRWSLVTPPGVADNGGIVSTAAPGRPLVAGFETSRDLGFSPLASTTSGRSWSPGVLPGSLARVPDALAEGSDGHVLALLAAGGGAVVSSPGNLSSWHGLVTERSLATSAAGKRCGIERLTAVGWTPAGVPVVGAVCAKRGRVGLFERGDGGWQLAGAQLTGALGAATAEVVRVSSASGALVALVAASDAGRSSLVVAWLVSSSSGWSISPPLQLARAQRLASSATTPAGGVAVVLTGVASPRAEVLAGPRAQWRQLPALPSATAAVAFSGSRVDALAVDGAKLTDYVLDAGTGSWRRTQVSEVPIQYSSSG